jgi:four helix bundle protein
LDDKTASDSLTPTHGTGLRVVDTAVGLASDILATVRTIRGHRDLVEQLKRATESTALNLAEGAGRAGRDKTYHYHIAYGSAGEAATALRLLGAYGELPSSSVADFCGRFDQLRAVTWRLSHPR